MQDVIAPYLTSTYQMIERAFPDGIDSQSYFPLLALLYDEMSDRNLARVVAECTGKNYAVVINDLYRVKSTDVPDEPAIAFVKERLLACGYSEWLKED